MTSRLQPSSQLLGRRPDTPRLRVHPRSGQVEDSASECVSKWNELGSLSQKINNNVASTPQERAPDDTGALR